VVEELKQEYQVAVAWRPFYLYFDTPPEGRELPENVKWARASGSEARLRQLAQSYGLEFQSTRRIYSTRLAHEATEYAREYGKASEFHRILFHEVFARGRDPSRWDVLITAAQEAGLDGTVMRTEVENGKYADNVVEQVKWAYRIGVSGVPTYVINDRYAIVGAQPLEVFRQAFERLEAGA